MKTKILLPIAIIAALPFTANADYTYTITNTPARVANNGNVTKADYTGPYQIATIGDDDDEHIASTAYVKGAYNDTIAAINTINETKQPILYLSDSSDPASDYVIQSAQFMEAIEEPLSVDFLMTAGAIVDVVDYKLDEKRVEIYTTWDDDDEVAEVPLITASGQ